MNVDQSSSWYGRRIGSKKTGFEEDTFDDCCYVWKQQTGVLMSIFLAGQMAPLPFTVPWLLEIVKILLDASADINCVDANGSSRCDVIALCPNTSTKSSKILETMLKGGELVDQEPNEDNGPEKKESYSHEVVQGRDELHKAGLLLCLKARRDEALACFEPSSTPPMTPIGVPSSPMWKNQLNAITPPSLQLPGSRLRTALVARNAVLEAELLGIENQRRM